MRTKLAIGAVVALLLGSATPIVAETLQITATSSPTAGGGQYAPRNVVAIWVQSADGTFVKTIGRWANTRKQHLVAWTTAAGPADADAVSGATRQNHATPLTLTWNVLGKQNAPLADGTYTIRMETTDLNANNAAQNNQATFTFVKGPAAQTQNNLANGGFSNVTITYSPTSAAGTCSNGVLDLGESCDPTMAGSCPASCAVSTDVCAPNVLVGSAATCDAECQVQTITTCIDGDGCCPEGCESLDEDCGEGSNEVTGGCASGGSGAHALFGLPALAMFRRKRRR